MNAPIRLSTATETILDLDTVSITRPLRKPSAEEVARLARNAQENEASLRSIHAARRQGKQSGVIEDPQQFGMFDLEAFGPTAAAVQIEIERYSDQGADPKRHHIRFFQIKADPFGGFRAHGLAQKERLF